MKTTYFGLLISVVLFISSSVSAAEFKYLTEKNYKEVGREQSILLLHVNWGRQWKCAGLDNAQLQSLSFSRLPLSENSTGIVSLEIPSKLTAKDSFTNYTLIIIPGEYALSEFDVKVAKSSSDVGHLKAGASKLFKEGKPIGGTFTVGPGEIVYIGHFTLDCTKEPILWRFYIEGRKEFERYVSGFNKEFPFVKDETVIFRLFSTNMFGEAYSLEPVSP